MKSETWPRSNSGTPPTPSQAWQPRFGSC